MEQRRRILVQAGLALVAALLAWQLRTEWQEANLRYSASPIPRAGSVAAAASPPQREPLAVEEIAAKNLFSADRNNRIAVPEMSQPGPRPPVPTVLGTLKLGDSFEALMSEGTGQGVRRVKQGEQVGAYRLVEIFPERVVVEYEGQTTTIDVYQSSRSVAQSGRPAPQPRTPAAPSAPPAPVVVETGRTQAPAAAARPTGTGPTAPATGSGQQVQDPNLPPFTRVYIEGNRRRFERDTPFGTQTWYEPLE